MKKLISLIVILPLLVNVHSQDFTLKEDMLYGTFKSFTLVDPDSTEGFTVNLTLHPNSKLIYDESHSYDLKEIRRNGDWRLSGDTVIIDYSVEWIQPLKKIKRETGFSFHPTNDSTIVKAEPFTIKYHVFREALARKLVLCPVRGGKCLIAYLGIYQKRID